MFIPLSFKLLKITRNVRRIFVTGYSEIHERHIAAKAYYHLFDSLACSGPLGIKIEIISSMTMHYRKEVGQNLRAARKSAGLKQSQVEEVSGVGYRHYQDIETGKVNVTLDTLCRLAVAFRTNVAKLTKGRC
jgi:DNA-binding XRE family transcriptional regulator